MSSDAGASLAPTLPGQSALDAIFDDIQAGAADADEILVLAWDEFTWHLHLTVRIP